MKKLATITLLAASALILVPKPAVAGNSGLAAIGGFIGGLIIGSNANSQPYCAPTYYPAPPVVIYDDGGYWQTSNIRIWIGPRWVVTYDRYNRPSRRYIAGHYENRSHRTRVAYNGHHRYNDRQDRNYKRRDREHRHSSGNKDRSDRRRNRH